MREAFGIDPASDAPLQGIVADRAGGGKPFLQIARFDQIAIPSCPNAGVAIGLQFHADLQLVGGLWLLRLSAADLVGEAGQVLNMMAIFMCHDIVPREIASRAHFPA